MNNKLTTLIIILLSMLTFVLAQDGPPALPGAGCNKAPLAEWVGWPLVAFY